MNKTILVLGGTGLLGAPVARRLQEDGFAVRILTRSPEKAQAMFDGALAIVSGDASNGDDVARALHGCHGVHISIAGPAELVAVQQVVRLAPAAGVKRITYISGCTVCEENRWFPMVDMKLRAEAALRAGSVPYTIFAPTWPMEMLARYARNGQPLLIGRQTYSTHFFAVSDLARLVSTAYQTEAAANRRFVVHGPEGIPFVEGLRRYCQTFHPEVEQVKSMPVWLVRIMAALMRNDMMKFGADLSAYFDKVGELGDPAATNETLGAPTMTLDAWLSARAATGS